MIYAMSDLHGCYDKYKKMLKKIDLTENDTLYILGDIVDRGNDGIKILLDMMQHKNIVPIVGNHDYMAYSVLKLNSQGNNSPWWYELRDAWISDGGRTTENSFEQLSGSVQKKLLSYLADFDVYETVCVSDNTYVLSHAGISNYEKGKELQEYELGDFIVGRMDYGKIYCDDFCFVSGHTITGLIDESYDGKIYKKNNHIAIDCGAVFGRPLGCICLDTLEEFYVE